MKAALRKCLRQTRRDISPAQRQAAALAIAARLTRMPEFLNSRHLGIYSANDGEVDPIIAVGRARRLNKQIYFPCISGRSLNFSVHRVGERMRRNRFGIAEPFAKLQQGNYLRAKSVRPDLLLLPLVGFDTRCRRLGMGGGYYDRYLAACKKPAPICIGLAFECQRVQKIPIQPWDVALDAIVTEARIYRKCSLKRKNTAVGNCE